MATATTRIVPWWTLLLAGTHWPTVVIVAGTGLFAAAFVGLPVMMTLGHGRRHLDWAAATGDALLGAMWVMFVWSVLAQLLRLALLVVGVEDPERSRVVAGVVVAVVVALVPKWRHLVNVKLRTPMAQIGDAIKTLKKAA